MSKTLVLRFQNVHFSYGEESILTGQSFSVGQSNHMVIKAKSGGGKSTILKLILGFLKPGQGRIGLYEGDKDKTAHIRSFTSWLPQDLNIGVGTVEDILNYPFQFAVNKSGMPGKEKHMEVLSRLDLSPDVYSKAFSDLSTGQRQRVGVALCYLLDKPLLLLDEPTASLDDANKQNVADLLLNGNKTIISTSHDQFWLNQATEIFELN